ncbi:MAG: RNA pyrophosphohydrolase [Pseudomonadota bacterium]
MTPEEIAKLPYRPNVGVMLVNADGQIFVGQRVDSKNDAWQMPQGGIDEGEDPREAALRELWEETGVSRDLVSVEAETEDWLTYDLPDDLIRKLWKGRFRGQRQKWFLMRFQGNDDQVDITAVDHEFSAWRWIAPDELIGAIVPFKKDVYTSVMAAFGDRL